MEFIPSRLDGAWCIKPKVHSDHRGFFLESFSSRVFSDHGITCAFIQDNHSKSVEKGVLRGLHFQRPPAEQAKLVRVTVGSIYDVIVDLRKKSPTFGAWEGFTISAENYYMLFVPRGFAHGFCTLEPNTEVQYKVDSYYSPQHDSGIIWNDASLAIDWPVRNPILSEKDQRLGTFTNLVSPF
jgi:dTDP-4-dehydrorhamnose 3,5-epimerase